MLVSRYSVVKDLREVKADALALIVFKDVKPSEMYPDVEASAGGVVTKALELGDFRGDEGEVLVTYCSSTPYLRVLAVGGGERSEATYETLRVYGGAAVSKSMSLGVKSLAIYLHPLRDRRRSLRAVAEGASLANYSFGRYKEVRGVSEVFIVGRVRVAGWADVLKEVAVVSEAYRIGRDLANSPAEDVNPESFEGFVREAFRGTPVRVRVLHLKELLNEGLRGIAAVGRGSPREPRLVILEYRGGGSGWYAVIGKGVCFDSGGLNLKTSQWMRDMKFDKAGAAYAVAIAYAAAKLKLPLNIVVLAPLVENLPSRNPYKPGDVIRMYNGLTVEVANTDAEGRIILADAIAYAVRNYRPRALIDLATLTSGIVVALGSNAAGLFSNDEELARGIERASEECGERVWRMPLWREYLEDIKSDVADLKNVGVPNVATPIAGAAFLSRFTDGTPWAHIDIAGTAWTRDEGPKKPYYPKGATGFGIRLVLEYLKGVARALGSPH